MRADENDQHVVAIAYDTGSEFKIDSRPDGHRTDLIIVEHIPSPHRPVDRPRFALFREGGYVICGPLP